MAIGVLRAVSALLSRAARKLRDGRLYRGGSVLLSRRLTANPFLGERKRHLGSTTEKKKKKKCDEVEEEDIVKIGGEDDDEVWRKGIIMGEKCEPFDFSGVIYYGSDGRQLAEMPKSPMRSHLPSYFLADDGKSWN